MCPSAAVVARIRCVVGVPSCSLVSARRKHNVGVTVILHTASDIITVRTVLLDSLRREFGTGRRARATTHSAGADVGVVVACDHDAGGVQKQARCRSGVSMSSMYRGVAVWSSPGPTATCGPLCCRCPFSFTGAAIVCSDSFDLDDDSTRLSWYLLRKRPSARRTMTRLRLQPSCSAREVGSASASASAARQMARQSASVGWKPKYRASSRSRSVPTSRKKVAILRNDRFDARCTACADRRVAKRAP
mmetsp:Transcript_22505/g.89368  ORF Transcript_22505/g.89368 Transcript_22505/m.89368 type:complete len:247 (-) Transcript_22505:692-1432(-)